MPTIKNNLISGGLVIIATAWTSTSLNAQYTFIGDGNWSTGSNWSHSSNNGEVPGTNLDEQAVINGGSTVTLNSTIPDVRAFRLEGGSGTATLNIEPGASFEFDTSTNWDSSIGRSGANGVVNQSGGDAVINFLELGRDNGLSGEYYLSGGELDISRVGRGVIKAGLIIATHDGGIAGGTATGLFEISGGSFTTRGGAWLGGTNGTANATFRVLGSAPAEIGIGTSNTGSDGNWTQNPGSTLALRFSPDGVTKILIDDHDNEEDNNYAIFENGSLLDVDYLNVSSGGTWTVFELENGDIEDNGLAFAPGVDTSVWSFAIDNSGDDGILTVTSSDSALRDVFWEGTTSTVWEDPLNWQNSVAPFNKSYAHIDGGTVNYTEDSVRDINLRGFRMTAGTLNLSADLTATDLASAYSQMDGTVTQTEGLVQINALELGRGTESNASYTLTDGELRINRGRNGYSLYLGSNSAFTDSGRGTLTISGGEFSTRTGVKLGDNVDSGTGRFTVLGADTSAIQIAGANDDNDGFWEQHSGSTLEVGVDFAGVTPIIIVDSSESETGTFATFENGALLDVDYYNITEGGGSWVVMEIENGPINDNGLAFAPGVDTSIWSFTVDNSGSNGRLIVSAIGDPLGHNLTIGNTQQQKMRYGMDYERLWFWTGGLNTTERDDIARWSAVDTDIDYVRVAINAGYELTEGDFNLSAYTNKIIPMMTEMQDANPNIKFFASPRPLDEAQNNVNWQPYPQWITGTTGNLTNYNLDWRKCAAYLERYILLMKEYGFQISFLDLTNEWDNVGRGSGAMDSGEVRDITEYLKANLEPEDMPLIIATSSFSYSQGNSWINTVNTTRRRNAIDIAASHNTGRDGNAVTFANRVRSVLGDDVEIWNTEVHGWKTTSGANETTSFGYYLEAIRAGFGGINGWLAIGTTNQGHAYILNPSGTPTRNIKYHIFQKLSSTSNYGYALDILDEPSASILADTSNDYDTERNTAAFIKGNLMTVWVINEHRTSVPLVITPSGRTIAETNIKRTRWTDPSDVEGFVSFEPVLDGSSFGTTIPGESVCCFEIVLDGEDFSNDLIEAEDYSHQWRTTLESGNDGQPNGQNLGNIANGDWVRYGEVALEDNSTMSFRIAQPAGRPEGKIEIREGRFDGELLGEIDIPVTGGWQNYQTIQTSLNVDAGIYNLYLNFVSEESASFVNFNWFTVNEPTLPSQPVGVTATATGDTQINLAWSPLENAESYEIARATSTSGPFNVIASNVTSTSYVDAGLSPISTYYYIVRGRSTSGTGPDSQVANATTEAEPIVAENLVISSIGFGANSSGEKQISFIIEESGLGQEYQVYSTETLLEADWQALGPIYEGTGALLSLDVLLDYEDPEYAKQFFRVEVSIPTD